MSAELAEEVSRRLAGDHCGWLTTVAKSGQPVPRLVWFYFDGTDVFVYSEPEAAKVSHVRARPRVSLNLDSDGRGGGIIVIGGTATIDAVGADPRDDGPYWSKYCEDAAAIGMAEEMVGYDTRIRIGIDRVWTTPS